MDIDIPIWVPVIILLAACGYWHIHENMQFSRQWQKTLPPAAGLWLKRLLWSRTIQLLFALACCVAIIIAYNFKLGESSAAQAKLSDAVSDLQKKNSDLISAASVKQQQPAQAVPPASATANLQVDDDSVDAIYNPEETTPDKQSKMDAIKKRYGDILVTYFFLRKCEKINPADYHIIMSALGQEMASINAPGRLQNDILTSAQGSYKEMYSTSKCTDEDTNTLSLQYSNYIDTLSKEYLPQSGN